MWDYSRLEVLGMRSVGLQQIGSAGNEQCGITVDWKCW